MLQQPKVIVHQATKNRRIPSSHLWEMASDIQICEKIKVQNQNAVNFSKIQILTFWQDVHLPWTLLSWFMQINPQICGGIYEIYVRKRMYPKSTKNWWKNGLIWWKMKILTFSNLHLLLVILHQYAKYHWISPRHLWDLTPDRSIIERKVPNLT